MERTVNFYLGKVNIPVNFIIDSDGLFCLNEMKFSPCTDDKGEVFGMKLVKIDVINGYSPEIIILPEWCVEIESNAMQKEYKSTVKHVIANGVKVLDDWAFAKCDALISCQMNSLEKIGYAAFEDCKRLRYIPGLYNIVPDGILGSTFSGCRALRGCVGRDGKIIEDYIYIPKNVNSMTKMFINCPNIRKVIFEHREKSDCSVFLHDTFHNCSKLSCVEGLEDNSNVIIARGAFAATALESVKVTQDNTRPSTDMTSAFESCIRMKKAEIDSNKVGSKMFSGCVNMNEVIFGDNVTRIEMEAFKYTHVEFVDFNKVSDVDFGAFQSSRVKVIKGNPAFGSYSLYGTNIESIEINNKIGTSCLSHSALKSLTFGPDFKMEYLSDSSIPLVALSKEQTKEIPIEKIIFDTDVFSIKKEETYQRMKDILSEYKGGLYYPYHKNNPYGLLVAYKCQENDNFEIHPDCTKIFHNCFAFMSNIKINKMILDLGKVSFHGSHNSFVDINRQIVNHLHLKSNSTTCIVDFHKLPIMNTLSFDDNINKVVFRNMTGENYNIIFPEKMKQIDFGNKVAGGVFIMPTSCDNVIVSKPTSTYSSKKEATLVIRTRSPEAMSVCNQFKGIFTRGVKCIEKDLSPERVISSSNQHPSIYYLHDERM